MKYYKQVKSVEDKGEFKFIENQYEDLVDDGRFYFRENVDARYIEPEMPEYRGNMLIEALSPAYELDLVFPKLKKLPIYHEKERYKNNLYREEAIYRLIQCVIPFVKYADIHKQISILLRRGYVHRRVMDKQFNLMMNENSKVMKSKGEKGYIKMKSISDFSSGPFPGFSVVGISGGGKSTALKNILSLYPQSINHKAYGGQNFLFRQLVYIVINCPHKGNLKGICKAFFTKVDEALGTNYLSKFGKKRSTEDDMLSRMAYITQFHALGVLVIDEIQNLSSSKNKGEDVLNFFVNLENRMHVPIVYCGTYKAIEQVLSSDFRQARRTSGMGEVYWNRMENDVHFEIFLNEIWNFQWLHNKVDINEKFIKTMYEETMGITDRVIKLFMATQLEAIMCKEEKITPDLIRKVAKEKMKLTSPMISAIRSGDPNKIAKYEDLYVVDYELIKSDYKEEFDNQEKIKKLYEFKNKEIELNKQEKTNELIFSMMELGINENKARKITSDILKEFGYEKDSSFLKKKIFKFIENNKATKKISKNKQAEYEEISGYDKLLKEEKIKGTNL